MPARPHKWLFVDLYLKNTAGEQLMKKLPLILLPLLVASPAASATSSIGGGSALALASLIAEASPLLNTAEKNVMVLLFDGKSFTFPQDRKIFIRADAVVCQESSFDFTLHECNLTFGTTTATLDGHKAYELNNILAAAGVPSEGAAGSIFEGLSHLICTIDANAVKDGDVTGVDCKFDMGVS